MRWGSAQAGPKTASALSRYGGREGAFFGIGEQRRDAKPKQAGAFAGAGNQRMQGQLHQLDGSGFLGGDFPSACSHFPTQLNPQQIRAQLHIFMLLGPEVERNSG